MADLHNVTSPIAKATAAAPTYTEGDMAGLSQDLAGNIRTTNSGSTSNNPSGAVTTTPVTAGASSTTWLAASTTRRFLQIKNESLSATVAFRLDGGTAAINTAGSITLVPGGSATYDSFVPTGAITGIASAASTPVTVESA